MTEVLSIHPKNPQPRLLAKTAEILRAGGIIVYPTDSAYALGCQIGNKDAADRIRQIRQLDKDHNFTLICQDLSELAIYAIVDNATFRLLKANTPGPYTYILRATKEVPRRLQHPKRKTIGVRVPDSEIVRALLKELGEPLMSVSLIFSGEDKFLVDVDEMYAKLQGKVDLILDAGPCSLEPTTVVCFLQNKPRIIRQGKGSATPFLD